MQILNTTLVENYSFNEYFDERSSKSLKYVCTVLECLSSKNLLWLGILSGLWHKCGT